MPYSPPLRNNHDPSVRSHGPPLSTGPTAIHLPADGIPDPRTLTHREPPLQSDAGTRGTYIYTGEVWQTIISGWERFYGGGARTIFLALSSSACRDVLYVYGRAGCRVSTELQLAGHPALGYPSVDARNSIPLLLLDVGAKLK